MQKRTSDLTSEIKEEKIGIDFKTLKLLNNDLLEILDAITPLVLRTKTGKQVKEDIEKFIVEKIEMIEDSTLILIR